MNQLLHWDKELFRLINNRWSNPFSDWLMPWLRNAEMWYPFYLFIILLIAVNFRKNVWWWIVLGAGTVILTDFISSGIIKANIIRTRPCNDAELASWIHVLVGYRPQSSSFTSSHAANHFGMAMYFYCTLKKYISKWALLFFAWAFAISISQVYVGVHYPLDITGGALIGILIGYLSGKSFNHNYGFD